MTNELKDKIRGFAKEYSANQVCAIFMINPTQLEEILNEKPVEKSTKKTPKIDIDPMFTEEEGL
jgi:hypothetical protein